MHEKKAKGRKEILECNISFNVSLNKPKPKAKDINTAFLSGECLFHICKTTWQCQLIKWFIASYEERYNVREHTKLWKSIDELLKILFAWQAYIGTDSVTCNPKVKAIRSLHGEVILGRYAMLIFPRDLQIFSQWPCLSMILKNRINTR